MSDEEKIEVGDSVWVGAGKVHWVVHVIGERQAIMRSGMTGRMAIVEVERLRLHSKAKS